MKNFSGYIFDLDGTIYLGEDMIPGAVDVIDTLQTMGKKVLFLTNKTIESRQKYVAKLNRFGIKVDLQNILSPALVTIKYLKEKHPGEKVYVIGEAILKEELEQEGILFASTPEETQVVLISWDREFHYSHLNFAYQAIKKGAVAIATNPDRTCPVPDGDVPDCGAMIGAIEGATGQKIDGIMGKPSILTASTALEILELKPEECLMIGDRVETDILMGKVAGLNTALVLTGITKRENMEGAPYQPDYILDSVYDIVLKRSTEESFTR